MAGCVEATDTDSHINKDPSRQDNTSDSRFILLLSPNVDDIPTGEHRHAAHCMIYCRTNKAWFTIIQKAYIMMQMRFDGYIGFPGGLVDPNESPVMAVNRELKEEIALDIEQYPVKSGDHLMTHFSKEKNLVLHFFTKSVTEEDFNKIQAMALTSECYGTEVLGTIIPPLFTMSNGKSGLPIFLTNTFVGNAQQQLLYALESCEILSKAKVNEALMRSRKLSKL